MKISQNSLVAEDCGRAFNKSKDQLSFLKGKTLLVTGGTGFMGSWLTEMVYFMNQNHEMNISLFLMARSQNRFEKNLPHIKNSSDIKFIYSDVIGNIVFPKKINYIIHAASNPDSRFHASQPFDSMISVAEGTSSVFKSASRLTNLENILNISSSSVYSETLQGEEKFCEEGVFKIHSSGLPNYFADSNLYAESLCAAARSQLRLPIVTVRPFTFCGPYQSIDSPWAINNFINDAINKRSILIHDDGEVIRSYMYGSDLAAWLLVILLHGRNGHAYNVGNTAGYTLKNIADKVANCFSPPPRIMINTSLTPGNGHSILLPDVSKSQKEFGLKLSTDINTAILRSVQWYKQEANYVE